MIKKDLARGKEGEDKVITLLQAGGIDIEKDDTIETRSHHDLRANIRLSKEYSVPLEGSGNANYKIVGEKAFTLEVKNDMYAAKSGNIALEVYNPKSNKLSGISCTKADIWVQIVNNEIWFANTKKLIIFIGQNQPKRVVYKAGDGNADLWLYDADMILPSVFIRVDDIPPNQLADTILNLLNGV